MKTTKPLVAVVFIIALFGAHLAQAQGSLVAYLGNIPRGTIVVHTKERALYFLIGQGTAIRYPVAVPKSSMAWKGSARITGKYWKPAWTPPPVVKRDHPELADYFPGGAPDNPMGVAALMLDRTDMSVAIHGTTEKMRKSIGTSASYGCIRMLNEDVADLYQRVQVGTLVIVRR